MPRISGFATTLVKYHDVDEPEWVQPQPRVLIVGDNANGDAARLVRWLHADSIDVTRSDEDVDAVVIVRSTVGECQRLAARLPLLLIANERTSGDELVAFLELGTCAYLRPPLEAADVAQTVRNLIARAAVARRRQINGGEAAP